MLVITGEVQVLTCGQNQWWLRTVGQPREQFPDVDIFLPPLAGHFLPGEGPVAGAVPTPGSMYVIQTLRFAPVFGSIDDGSVPRSR